MIALATGAFSSKSTDDRIAAPSTGSTVAEEPGQAGATPFPETDWGTYGLTFDQLRHSPLTEITKDNVQRLGRVFSIDFRELDRSIPRGQQSFPLVIDGVIYVTTGFSHVFAIDGRTGKTIWHFVPPDIGIFKNFGLSANRGAAYCDGKLFVLTLDMRLISIDAASGELVEAAPIADAVPDATTQFGYSQTMAPVCYDNLVLIGASGSDAGARGFVMAYHTDLSPAWPTPYWTIPPWGQDWRSESALAGGGTSWNPATIDVATGTMYITTSHPSPIYFPELRPGPDPRSNSLIALDVRTGRQKWWRQQLAGDQWAYGTQQPALVYDAQVGDTKRRIVSVATKEGYWFAYDAKTGEPIYERVRLLNQVEHPPLEPGKPVVIFPGSIGGVNYSPSSYDPGTGFVVNSQAETSLVLVQKPRDEVLQHYVLGDVESGISNGEFGTTPEGWHDYGAISAVDVSTGQVAWKTVTPEPGRGGVTTTASGLTFAGGGDGVLRALDTLTGNVLWQFQTGYQIAAGPSIYEIDGKQYIAITTGGTPTSSYGGTASRLDVFALDGSTEQSEAPELRNQDVLLPGQEAIATRLFGLGRDSRTLTVQAIAAVDPQTSSPTLDGGRDGSVVVTVPLDWTLNMTFKNDGAGSDGLVVVPLSGSAPDTAADPAFTDAATPASVSPGGIAYFSFRASTEGRYAISTTDSGDGAWITLVVGPTNTVPSIVLDGETFTVDVTRPR